MSGALDPQRLAEYRRKIRDPRYLAHALVQVASVLVDMLVHADRGAVNGSGNGCRRRCR